MAEIATLKKINLRDVWQDEGQFSDWIAANLSRLGAGAGWPGAEVSGVGVPGVGLASSMDERWRPCCAREGGGRRTRERVLGCYSVHLVSRSFDRWTKWNLFSPVTYCLS
jgi:hypothetical protein